jgi:RHS repeat-associated protein
MLCSSVLLFRNVNRRPGAERCAPRLVAVRSNGMPALAHASCRLTRVQRGNSRPAFGRSRSRTKYAYDNAFRVTGLTNASNSALSWTYGYDLLDRLTSASKSGTALSWTYDADGNRSTQTGAASTGFLAAGVTLAFNDRNRAASATVGSTATAYIYNALGQRVRKSGGPAGTILSMYDEAGHLLGEYNGTGGLIQETVWLGDIPVATIQPNGSSVAVYYIHVDHLNAPRMITRPADNGMLWRWDTDPFATATPNQNPQNLGAFVYNLRYPGQYYDSETGFNYNVFRDYDPQTGRYIESDPIGLEAGVNTFAYVRGNPVGRMDPLGLWDPQPWNNAVYPATANCTCTITCQNDPERSGSMWCQMIRGRPIVIKGVPININPAQGLCNVLTKASYCEALCNDFCSGKSTTNPCPPKTPKSPGK